MVPRVASSMANESDLLAERPVASSPSDKKIRVPKKIHKAEREKLKRDHLNELFQELGQTLEPARQNNGKASILGDTSKLLRDLISQVESLRRENAALQNESRYVTVERNELKDENIALGVEIENMHMEIRERIQSNPSWSNAAPASTSVPQPPTTSLPIQQPPLVGSMYVLPVHPDQPCTASSDPANAVPNPTAHIRRPHARYPTPTDSWPFQILSQQHGAGNDGNGATTSDGVEEVPSSPRELLLLI